MKTDALDRAFSEYIRLRDSDENGLCRCISCGKIHAWNDIDCGHFVNRRHMSTRFDEINGNAQCRSCNYYDEGNPVGYAKGLIEKYGAGIIDELLLKKKLCRKWSQFEIDELAKYYRKKCKELLKSKQWTQ